MRGAPGRRLKVIRMFYFYHMYQSWVIFIEPLDKAIVSNSHDNGGVLIHMGLLKISATFKPKVVSMFYHSMMASKLAYSTPLDHKLT